MKLATLLPLSAVVLLLPSQSQAHCDALDGPVVKTATKALETGKLGPVLAWVQAKDEAEIKTVFAKTLAVRKLGPAAKELADRHFFETLVRVHRAGEGAPYTGLKPAGSVKDPALAAADKAIETGKPEPVAKLLGDAVKAGLTESYTRLRALEAPGDDPARGRQWVAAYVTYVHYVTGIHKAVAAGHGDEAVAQSEAHHKHHAD